jgi:SRSO17 transposase
MMKPHPGLRTARTTTAEAAGWADQLEAMFALIHARFSREEPRQHALAYLKGLLAPVERKNGWQLAEAAGDATPYAIQHLLGRAQWSAHEVRDDLQQYVTHHLGDPQAVLIIDETGFLKKGDKSAGVQRQYSGTAGRIENCQIGVFLAYASPRGRTFLDRELYLPQQWADSPERRQAAGVPVEVKFATKPQLARQMIERALQAGVPCKWVTGDEVYGNDRRLRVWLEEQGVFHVLAVGSGQHVWVGFQQVRIKRVVEQIPATAWQVVSAGDGAKGPRLYEWAYLPLTSILIEHQRGLLVRRRRDQSRELAYYVVFAPRQTRLEEMVGVAGTRWAIEESFQSAKGEVGLDHYEVRSWPGWYRHMTLALLAHAYLTVVRSRTGGEAEGGKKKSLSRRRRRP